RLEEGRPASVEDLVVLGIDSYLAVIHRPIVIVADQLPALAFIVRAPDSAALWVWRPVRLLAGRTRLGLGARLTLRSGLTLLALTLPASARTRFSAAGLLLAAASAGAHSDFDLGINDIWVGTRNVEPDTAEHLCRKSRSGHLGPILSRIGSLPNASARPAAIITPGGPAPLIGGSV